MSKHKYRSFPQPPVVPRQVAPAAPEQPRADNVPAEPRAYTSEVRNLAPPCTSCKALLEKSDPPRQQSTRVYCTRGRIQYVICNNCGATWKAIVT